MIARNMHLTMRIVTKHWFHAAKHSKAPCGGLYAVLAKQVKFGLHNLQNREFELS